MPYPPPQVTNVLCSQQIAQPTFGVTWDNTNYPPLQQYVIGIFDQSLTDPITISDPVMGSMGSVTASQTMDPSRSYQVRVTTYENGTPDAWPPNGPPALFVSPVNLAISYDGETISATWQNPAAGTPPLGGRITIAIGQGQWVFDLSGTQGAFVPQGVPLTPSQPATLTVSGLYGASQGPPGAGVTLLQLGYGLKLIDNPGINPRTIAAQGFVSGTPRSFNVTLTSGDTVIQTFSNVTESASGSLSLTFASEPVPGAPYELAVSQTTGTSTGPLGPRAALVVVPPTVDSVSYTAGATNSTLGYAVDLPLGTPFPSGMQITVLQGTTVAAQSVVNGGYGRLQIASLGGANYVATFRAALGLPYGISLGPPAAATPAVLSAAPTVTSVKLTGSFVEAQWSASTQAGVNAYRLELVSGANPIASAEFGGTSGWIAANVDPNVPLSAQVRAIGDQTVGTACAPVAAVVASPAIMSATTDPIAGKTTISWNAVPQATSYTLQLFANGQPSGPAISGLTGTTYLIATPIAPAARWSAALSAVVAVSSTVTSTGPFGTPYDLPTAQPSQVSVDYDGVVLTAWFTPDPRATGYVASVYAAGEARPLATASAPAGATRVTFPPFTTTSSATYSVVIQAQVGADTGPPTPAVPLFAPAWFVGTPTTNAPNVRPASSLAFANQDITLYLPDLGAGTPLQGLPFTQGPFTLAVNPDQGTSGTYPYMLTIPASSAAWVFDATPVRTQLQSDYVAFLTGLETKQAVPWGIGVLQQAISRAMPQTFQETLYYAYGVNLTTGTADLRPGMVVRVVINDFLDVGNTAPSPWINGYVGGPVLDYDVSSYMQTSLTPARQWTLGFDALLSQLAANGLITVQPPPNSPTSKTEAGIAEAVDMYYPAFPQPFYRLFFPQDVMSPTGVLTAFTPSQFVLASAASYTALAATVNYPATGNNVIYFRGRAVLKVCIRVIVNGIELTIPIGTTVGNILERYANQVPSAPVTFDGVSLDRSTGLAVTNPALPVVAGATTRVRLDWNRLPVYGPARDALSLPLLHGDRLTIG